MASETVFRPSPAASKLSVLAQPNFRLFFLGASISKLGTAVSKAGLTLALLVAGYSPSVVGIVLAAELVPTILFSLAGGVFGDWWSRRGLMIASDILRCGSQGVLAILLAIGHPNIIALALLSACLGLGDAFYTPAVSGLVPQIMPDDRLKDANSLISLSSSLAMVLGPAIGGLLVGFGGGVIAIAADAASYGVSAACMAFVKFPARTVEGNKTNFISDLRSGWQEFRRHTWLKFLTAQIALQNAVALGMFFVIGPSIFAHLHGGPQEWGIVIGGVGAGGLAGGLIVLRFQFPRPLIGVEMHWQAPDR